MAPTRFSARETVRAIKRWRRSRKIPTPRQLWREVSVDRLLSAPFIMSAGEVAWALALEAKWVYRAIRNGTLPAEKEQLEDGRYRWRILRSEVERIADDLNAGVSESDEYVETVRLAEFEGRAGEDDRR